MISFPPKDESLTRIVHTSYLYLVRKGSLVLVSFLHDARHAEKKRWAFRRS